MSEKKNVLSVVLLLLLTAVILSACGRNDNTADVSQNPPEQEQNNAPRGEMPPAAGLEQEQVLTEAEIAVAAAKDFLNGYLSLFGEVIVGFSSESDFVHGNFPELLYSFAWDEEHIRVIDKHFNTINDVPFVIPVEHGAFVAENYALYDFNDDGVPEIIITYEGLSMMGYLGGSVLYQFIDGSYRPAWNREEAWQDFGRVIGIYTCPDGDVIAHIERHIFDTSAGAYFRLNFSGGRAEPELIAEYDLGWGYNTETDEEMFFASGFNYLTEERFRWDSWEHYIEERNRTPHTVPGSPEMVLTLFSPLTQLQNETEAVIRRRLAGEPDEPEAQTQPPAATITGGGSPLTGTWRHETENFILEFRANGTGTASFDGDAADFIWSSEGWNLTMEYPGEGSETGEFLVSGNSLALFQGRRMIDVFTRIDGSPVQAATGGSLVGRWTHNADEGYIEFSADGTGTVNERGNIENFTWTAQNGILGMSFVIERDFGGFTVRFQQSLDAQFGEYWTGYWLEFENRAFYSSEPFRYKQLDGEAGEIYGRWAWDLMSIQADVTWFEIFPDGTGNNFPGAGSANPNPDPVPFTWRIESGRFIYTEIAEGEIDFSIDGDTLTIFEIGDGWIDVDRFTRQ